MSVGRPMLRILGILLGVSLFSTPGCSRGDGDEGDGDEGDGDEGGEGGGNNPGDGDSGDGDGVPDGCEYGAGVYEAKFDGQDWISRPLGWEKGTYENNREIGLSENSLVFLDEELRFDGREIVAGRLGVSERNVHMYRSGDLDGDGITDLIGYEFVDPHNSPPTGRLGYLASGQGEYQLLEVDDDVAESLFATWSFEAQDLDGDGAAELLIGTNGGLVVLRNDGFGQLSLGQTMEVTGEVGDGFMTWASGMHDLNGDGVSDYVGSSDVVSFTIGDEPAPFYTISLAQPDGTMGPLSFYPMGAPWNRIETPHFGVEDFDSDGDLDLLTLSMTSIHFSAGKGDGTFEPSETTFTEDQPDSEVETEGPMASGDFNGDERGDVVFNFAVVGYLKTSFDVFAQEHFADLTSVSMSGGVRDVITHPDGATIVYAVQATICETACELTDDCEAGSLCMYGECIECGPQGCGDCSGLGGAGGAAGCSEN